MAAAPDNKPRVRHWPRIWWHDEKFWREVATRAIAGLIVVFIGYLFAVAAGYLQFPTVRVVVAWALAIATIFTGAGFTVWMTGYLRRHRQIQDRQGKKRRRWLEELIYVVALLVIAGVVYLTIAIISAWGGLGTAIVH